MMFVTRRTTESWMKTLNPTVARVLNACITRLM
ncbi:hypothetical protein OKW34_004164 [Paraburkholderia youngii]